MNLEAREKRMLWVLVAVAVLAGWFYGRPALVGWLKGGVSDGASRGRRVTTELPVSPLVELRLESLAAEPGEYSPGRNIFSYGQRPRTPPPPPKVAPPPREPRPVVDRTPPPPPDPRPPPVEFDLMGVFGPDYRQIAVLVDDKDIINVLEGDVIRESFIVVDIDYLWIDVGFVDFPDEPPERLEIER